MDRMSDEEFLQILQQMNRMPTIFHKMWEMGNPYFVNDSSMPTACVTFNESGDLLEFLINKNFWKTLNNYQKVFVISHECLHIFFDHGKRFFMNDNLDVKKANIATDLVINHTLVDAFKFQRSKVDPKNLYCWVDKFFSDEDDAERKSAEWYYTRLPDKLHLLQFHIVDFHEGFSNDGDVGAERINEFLKSNFTEDEVKNIEKLLDFDSTTKFKSSEGAKYSPIAEIFDIKLDKVVKKKWESVIKNWTLKSIKKRTKAEMQWIHLNRRFSSLSTSLILPTEQEIEIDKKDKINVWFFLDTSGSCASYAKRFFKAASSLPEEHFDVNLYCFDTKVYHTTLESGRLYGFGGTKFNIIESYIQKSLKKSKQDYPHAVFVITDGWGNMINPQKPENWYWFMTPRNTVSYVPKNSNVYKLSDFE